MEFEVYDLAIDVTMIGVSGDKRARVVLTMSADLDWDEIEKLKPIFDEVNRIRVNEVDYWKIKLERKR